MTDETLPDPLAPSADELANPDPAKVKQLAQMEAEKRILSRIIPSDFSVQLDGGYIPTDAIDAVRNRGATCVPVVYVTIVHKEIESPQ